MIILSSADDKIEFSSWAQIEKEITQKQTHCPEVPTSDLLQLISEIKSVCPSSFFNNPTFEHLKSVLNQVKYYTDDGKHFGFVHELHDLAILIKETKQIPNSAKLFKAGIFSNFGLYTQFQVTIWLSRYISVVDMELHNKPLNTDVLANVSGSDIHFHVKDIREEERRIRAEHAVIMIESVLTAKARERRADKILAVTKFEGVPPASLFTNYWEDFAAKLEEKPQKMNLTFPSNNNSTNTDDIPVDLEFGWRPWNGIYESATASFNNSRRLIQEYEKLRDKVKNTSLKNNEVHILVAITEDEYDWKEFKESVKDDLAGLVVLEIFDNVVERSPFMLPLQYQQLEDNLNSIIPEYVDLLP